MLVMWTLFITIYFAVPITYDHAPGPVAWSLMLSGIVLYCLGAGAASLVPLRSHPQHQQISEAKYDAVIIACALLGLAGALAMAIDKLFLSGIDWSIGMSAVRDRRAVEVMQGVAIRRSILLYAGYLTFSFSCVGFTLFLLAGDRVGRAAAWLGQIGVVAIVIYALLYGGRMPIMLVILLAAGAMLTRALRGSPLLPKGWAMWPKIVAVCVAFLIYTNFIWADRRAMNRILDFHEFVHNAEVKWEARTSPWITSLVRSGAIEADTAMNWVSIAVYLTHSPTSVQRMVEHSGALSTYGGLYQIGVLSPLFDVFAPQFGLPQKMRRELSEAGLYGWFPNAWGAWLMDAGRIGGAICILLWGFLSGIAYRMVRHDGGAAPQLMLTFAYLSILVSPLNGPFGLANSFLIFSSFVAVCLWIEIGRSFTSARPIKSMAG
jgi:hypothetical protein